MSYNEFDYDFLFMCAQWLIVWNIFPFLTRVINYFVGIQLNVISVNVCALILGLVLSQFARKICLLHFC